MSGECVDCGNVMCVCDLVEADSVSVNAIMEGSPIYNKDVTIRDQRHKIIDLELENKLLKDKCAIAVRLCELREDRRRQDEKIVELRALLNEFLDHYNSRKITNGFHDLLAVKVEKTLKKN